jgi:CRISPR-associated protein Cas2
MWLAVMYDLPVGTKAERKAAADFRNDLLDLGFIRMQYSVYLRCCSDRDMVETMCQAVTSRLPETGCIKFLVFTDKQYENIRVFVGRRRAPNPENPSQLVMF